jgi:hypothetical protein
VVEHPGDEEVGVEGDGEDERERGEAEPPPHAPERVRQREHRWAHDGRRQVEPRVPPRPCTRARRGHTPSASRRRSEPRIRDQVRARTF